MVEMSTSGSGEGPGKATTRAYSTEVARRWSGRGDLLRTPAHAFEIEGDIPREARMMLPTLA